MTRIQAFVLIISFCSGTRHLQEIADAGLELPSVNQVELHPFCQQKEIVKWCTDNGVVVEVRGYDDCTYTLLTSSFIDRPTVLSSEAIVGTIRFSKSWHKSTGRTSGKCSFVGASRKG